MRDRSRSKIAITFTVLALVGIWLFGPTWETPLEQIPEVRLARAEVLDARYAEWSVGFANNGGGNNLVVPIGWAKGLSSERIAARGLTRIDVEAGRIEAEVYGLPSGSAWELWLVDNQPGEGRSVLPETGDRTRPLGELVAQSSGATLETTLEPDFFDRFELDLVVLTRAGQRPEQGLVLSGAPTLFERRYIWGGRMTAGGERSSFGPQAAFADSPFNSMDPLIALGADLFFNETFDGNGRTCASCHPAENNFTIDPRFISELDNSDPLFVAEQVPALAELENSQLLRELGLIQVNADGFDNPAVLRPPQHLLGLSRYLEPGNQAVPPLQRTGWGGDGSPGGGTLREFPIGAITQHMTASLERTPGIDFRLPTDEELDALEAFTLALGRQDNPDLTALTLSGPIADRGRELFLELAIGRANCTFCHAQAGANGPDPALNSNFDIGISSLPEHPAELIQPGSLNPDGGFGTTPLFDPDSGEFLGFGTIDPDDGNERRFNSQPIIEAVDTAPFFHNNAVQTIEEAIAFYNSDAFGNSGAGGLRSNLASTEVEAIATFLRVMNVLENIRASNLVAEAARDESDRQTSKRLASLAAFDTQDGFQVFDERFLYPVLSDKLHFAYQLEHKASKFNSRPVRNFLLAKAIELKEEVAEELVLP